MNIDKIAQTYAAHCRYIVNIWKDLSHLITHDGQMYAFRETLLIFSATTDGFQIS